MDKEVQVEDVKSTEEEEPNDVDVEEELEWDDLEMD